MAYRSRSKCAGSFPSLRLLANISPLAVIVLITVCHKFQYQTGSDSTDGTVMKVSTFHLGPKTWSTRARQANVATSVGNWEGSLISGAIGRASKNSLRITIGNSCYGAPETQNFRGTEKRPRPIVVVVVFPKFLSRSSKLFLFHSFYRKRKEARNAGNPRSLKPHQHGVYFTRFSGVRVSRLQQWRAKSPKTIRSASGAHVWTC